MKSTPASAHDIVTGAARKFGSSAQCSITVRRHGNYVPAVSSGRRAAICDAVEAELASGPCVMAMVHLRGVLVDDIAACDQWPEWCRTALETGFRSAAAMPAVVDRDTVIAVNVYCDAPRAWGGDDILQATLIAGEVAQAIASAPLGHARL